MDRRTHLNRPRFIWPAAVTFLACSGGSSVSDPNGGPNGGGSQPEAVLVGAGDIASCSIETDEATAVLLDDIAGTVFTAGDNAYQSGTAEEFQNCYEPTWGRHKARTRPAPGNHDYFTDDAEPYFNYFGFRAGPRGLGYYAYDLGSWHIIALNSNIGVDSNSAQAEWLREDLAANPTLCALAYWHHPLFSSGEKGNFDIMRPFWRILDEAGVDVVIAAHDHDYERFDLQNANGDADPNGIRSFVVGTGGDTLDPFESIKVNSVVRNAVTHGVLKLELFPGRYEWEFVPVAGRTFTDRGVGQCAS